MKTFMQAWAEKRKQGYQYGRDALENVRFGWDMHIESRATDDDLLRAVDLLRQLAEDPSDLHAWARAKDFLSGLDSQRSQEGE